MTNCFPTHAEYFEKTCASNINHTVVNQWCSTDQVFSRKEMLKTKCNFCSNSLLVSIDLSLGAVRNNFEIIGKKRNIRTALLDMLENETQNVPTFEVNNFIVWNQIMRRNEFWKHQIISIWPCRYSNFLVAQLPRICTLEVLDYIDARHDIIPLPKTFSKCDIHGVTRLVKD